MQGVSVEEIPRITAPPREEFMRRWERPGRPVVVRGLTEGWRRPGDWTAERLAAGTVTPLHRDVPHNLHVHLRGRKRWLLFPPQETSRLYSRGLFSGMPNFSAVDPEEPDYARYPRFRGARALGATLEAGETLFIPHGWWHHTPSWR